MFVFNAMELLWGGGAFVKKGGSHVQMTTSVFHEKMCVGWGKEGANAEGKNCFPPLGILKYTYTYCIHIYI